MTLEQVSSEDTLARLQAEARFAAAHGIEFLRAIQRPDGAWTDRLSSSAVATALGVLSLARAGRDIYAERIDRAISWLLTSQRTDGGWAMADAEDPSSPGMTSFAVAALHEVAPDTGSAALKRAWAFLDDNDAETVVPGLRGEAPRTWPAAAPIIWALTGIRDAKLQPDQPVETVLLPHSIRNKVSIALPVVLALGVLQARTLPRSWIRSILARVAVPRALAWIREASGANGGIEECPMIAGFVYLSLREADEAEDLQRASLCYLLDTQRSDGSWAIDRDLEISVTAYAVMALAEFGSLADAPELHLTRDWLLRQQWNRPLNILGISAGGWSWANPSGWPESEDTAVVLGALAELGLSHNHPAVRLGVDWLIRQQNRDGSWSEWVRNSTIMNDRPCAGVTAHVVMALHRLGEPTAPGSPIRRGLDWLAAHQSSDGSIASVWFRDNLHGTCRLLEAWSDLGWAANEPVALKARQWLLSNQGDDGGWPKQQVLPPARTTVEETAWALYALMKAGEDPRSESVTRGIRWLTDNQTAAGTWTPSSVGLYFDDLCYTDDLIAHTFALRSLGRWLASLDSTQP